MKGQTNDKQRDQDLSQNQQIPSRLQTSSKRTKILAEAAMMTALAGVINAFPLGPLPFGGAATLGGMVPILFLALRRGAKVGIAAGAALGIIVLYVQPAATVNAIQFLFDYPLAFGALGLAGFFQRRPLVGVGAGIVGRFTFHFISGILFFAVDAPVGMSPFVYSALYNGSYMSVEFVTSTVVMFLLVKRNLLRAYI